MTAADTIAESKVGSLTARYILSVTNALMAVVVGSLTIGVGFGIVAALVLAGLPFSSVMVPAVIDWAKEYPPGAALGAFLLSWIIGTVIWGLWFAFGVALFLAPTMLTIVVYLTLGKPVPVGDH